MKYFSFALVVSTYVFVLRLANNPLFLVDEEQITNLADLGKASKAPKTLNYLFFCIHACSCFLKYHL